MFYIFNKNKNEQEITTIIFILINVFLSLFCVNFVYDVYAKTRYTNNPIESGTTEIKGYTIEIQEGDGTGNVYDGIREIEKGDGELRERIDIEQKENKGVEQENRDIKKDNNGEKEIKSGYSTDNRIKLSSATRTTTGTKLVRMLKKGFDEDKQDLIDVAFKLGGEDFVLTLNTESATWTTDRRSMRIGANGYYDYGICQLNKQRHKKFINSKEFKNPYEQIKYCYGVRQDAIRKGKLRTTFYGYNVRYKSKQQFLYIYE